MHTQSPAVPILSGTDLAKHGNEIGRYRILDELGRGGMGIIYRAFDPQLARVVALKVVSPDIANQQEHTRARELQLSLVQEAKAAANVSHPNIVGIYDAGITDGFAYVAMELVRGPDLKAWHATQHPRYREKIRVLLQAGEGLAAIHHAGLVHHDVKPQNILIDEDGTARVTDFGLAGRHDPSRGLKNIQDAQLELTEDEYRSVIQSGRNDRIAEVTQVARTRVAVGTPAYMAPEQHFGQAGRPTADQYAFCVTAMTLLIGRSPFIAESIHGIVGCKVAERIIPWRPGLGCSRRVYRILRRGLRALPEDRYPTLEQLLQELETATQPLPWQPMLWATCAMLSVASLFMQVLPEAIVRPPVCVQLDDSPQAGWQSEDKRLEMQQRWNDILGKDGDPKFRTLQDIMDKHTRAATQELQKLCDAVTDPGSRALTYDQAMSCLELHETELNSIAEVALQVTPQNVDRIISTARNIRDPSHCTDLNVSPQKPAPLHLRSRARALEARLQRAIVLARANWNRDVERELRNVIKDADNLGYARLQVESLQALGISLSSVFRVRESVELHEKGMAIAERTGDHALTAGILLSGIHGRGYLMGDLEAGQELLAHAYAHLRAAGYPDEINRRYMHAEATMAYTRRDKRTAAQGFYREYELLSITSPNSHYQLGLAIANAGYCYAQNGDLELGLSLTLRGLESFSKELPWDHPDVQRTRVNLTELYVQRGEFRLALDDLHAMDELAKAYTLADRPRALHLRSTEFPAYLATHRYEKALESRLVLEVLQRESSAQEANPFSIDFAYEAFLYRILGRAVPPARRSLAPTLPYAKQLDVTTFIPGMGLSATEYLAIDDGDINAVKAGLFAREKDFEARIRLGENPPHSFELLQNALARGELAFATGRWDAAIDAFQEARRYDSEIIGRYNDHSVRMDIFTARALLRTAKLDEAQALLERAQFRLAESFDRLDPITQPLVLAQVELQWRRGNNDRALAILEESSEASNREALPLLVRAERLALRAIVRKSRHSCISVRSERDWAAAVELYRQGRWFAEQQLAFWEAEYRRESQRCEQTQ